MIISNELLAAYAEGKVSKEEKAQVRQYLAENPSEIESVMVLMDEDYEMEPDDNTGTIGHMDEIENASLVPNLCYSAAAFVPQTGLLKRIKNNIAINRPKRDRFSKCLDDLFNEI